LSRGDRRLADVLLHVYKNGGKFESSRENFDFNRYANAMTHFGLSFDDYLGEKSVDKPLPWDFIRIAVSKEFLLAERSKAYGLK